MSWLSNITSNITKAATNVSNWLGLTVQAQVGTPKTIDNGPTYAANPVMNPELPKLAGSAAAATVIANPAALSTAINKGAELVKGAGQVLSKTVQTSFQTAPIKSTAVAVAAIPVTAAVVSSSKLQNSIVKAPSELANFGSNVGKLIDNPTIANVKETFKENPILSGAAIAAGAAVVGGGLGLAANTVATFMNTKATKENSLASTEPSLANTEPIGVQLPQADLIPSKSLAPEPKTAPTANLVAQPQKSLAKRKRKRAKKPILRAAPSNVTKVLNILTSKQVNYG